MEGIYIEGRGKEEKGQGVIYNRDDGVNYGIDIDRRGKEEIHRMME